MSKANLELAPVWWSERTCGSYPLHVSTRRKKAACHFQRCHVQFLESEVTEITYSEEAIAYFGEAISLYLDSGSTRYGIPNTIIDLTQTPMALLRQGPVSLQGVKQLIVQRVKLPRI